MMFAYFISSIRTRFDNNVDKKKRFDHKKNDRLYNYDNFVTNISFCANNKKYTKNVYTNEQNFKYYFCKKHE